MFRRHGDFSGCMLEYVCNEPVCLHKIPSCQGQACWSVALCFVNGREMPSLMDWGCLGVCVSPHGSPRRGPDGLQRHRTVWAPAAPAQGPARAQVAAPRPAGPPAVPGEALHSPVLEHSPSRPWSGSSAAPARPRLLWRAGLGDSGTGCAGPVAFSPPAIYH